MLQQISMLLPLTCILGMMTVVPPAFEENNWTPATMDSEPIILIIDHLPSPPNGYRVFWDKLPNFYKLRDWQEYFPFRHQPTVPDKSCTVWAYFVNPLNELSHIPIVLKRELINQPLETVKDFKHMRHFNTIVNHLYARTANLNRMKFAPHRVYCFPPGGRQPGPDYTKIEFDLPKDADTQESGSGEPNEPTASETASLISNGIPPWPTSIAPKTASGEIQIGKPFSRYDYGHWGTSARQ